MPAAQGDTAAQQFRRELREQCREEGGQRKDSDSNILNMGRNDERASSRNDLNNNNSSNNNNNNNNDNNENDNIKT